MTPSKAGRQSRPPRRRLPADAGRLPAASALALKYAIAKAFFPSFAKLPA